MKYANYTGVLAALALMVSCFLPWVYISSLQLTFTGMFTGNTNLGKPGIMNLLMAVISVVCFIVPALWAKRLNLFICAFNLAWAVRNFLLVTQCQMGECPEKKAGIYAMLLLSALMMVMAMFPKVKLKENFS